MNCFDQVLAYENYINLIADDTREAREEIVQALLNAFRDIGLEINVGKTAYMETNCHRDILDNESVTIGINSNDKMLYSKPL